MPLEPRESDLPRIAGALKFYQIASIITGAMLLALCAEMVMKYAFGLELELGGAYGFLAFVPTGTAQAVNLSTGILIAHGWFYVLYLFSNFRLWSMMRWEFPRLLLLASGGIVPGLSFFLETRIAREVRTYLAARAERTASASSASPSSNSVEASH
ncbi:DUF3817 domain-containing protein [Mycetocola zhadangensis]|uniref:DUF3817 domain-containing protein n=1 Tax=Mycetocola zhadangensis TaxID=1164595 RepID=A0A3L7J468_9MICO|nr:DUF3817 domain-containing protein [Mycetocola zhadangensis]RLQ85456.1 DUF3817 domain-containing protein [Mycetocola zhadangensis]GGE82723.1 membrane protein [Mycetocola zhadangensis]